MAKKNQESPYPPQVNYDQFDFEIGRKGQRIKPVDIFSNAPAQYLNCCCFAARLTLQRPSSMRKEKKKHSVDDDYLKNDRW